MDWASMLGSIIAALVFAIGLPLALRKRKKGGPQNVGQFLHHLHEIGVKASMTEKSVGEGRCEGVIKIEARNIDYISG